MQVPSVRGIANDVRARVENYRAQMAGPSYLFDKAEAVALHLQWLAEAVDHATAHELVETNEDTDGGAILVAKDAKSFVVARLGPNLFMQGVLMMRTPSRYDAIRSALDKHIKQLRTAAAKQRLRAAWLDKSGDIDRTLESLRRIVFDVGVMPWRRSRVLVLGQGQVGKSSLSARLQGGGKQIEFMPTRGFFAKQVARVEINHWEELDEKSLVAEGVSMVAAQAAGELECVGKVSQPRTLPHVMPTKQMSELTDWELLKVAPLADGFTKLMPTKLMSAWTQWGPLEIAPIVDNLFGIIAEVAESKPPPLRLSVWDFGGQLVFHAVHHLFFTRIGCYVLTFSCVEWLHANPARQRRARETLRHWLRVVSSCAKGAPIFFVGTFASSLKSREDLFNISTSLEPIVQLAVNVQPCIRKKHHLLFWPVDNTYDDNADFDDLRSRIEVCIENDCEENGVNDEVPQIWMEALAEVLVRRRTDKVIPQRALASLFRNLHARIGTRSRKATMLEGWNRNADTDVYEDDDTREAALFLKRAHDLGIVAHFGQVKREVAMPFSKSAVFLDPEWLINMITRIVRNFLIHHDEGDERIWTAHRSAWAALQEGVLDAHTLLPLLWRDVDFPVQGDDAVQQCRETLLAFMCEVRLLAPRQGNAQVYWIPSILPFGAVADNVLSFSRSRICHSFHFEILPGGFFSKLLAGLLQQEQCRASDDHIRRSEAVLTIGQEVVFICEVLDHDNVVLVLLVDRPVYQKTHAVYTVEREITLLVETLYNNLLKFRSTMMVARTCPRARYPLDDPFRTEYLDCGFGCRGAAKEKPSQTPAVLEDRVLITSDQLLEQLDSIFKDGPLYDPDQSCDVESFFSLTDELRFRQLVDWIDVTANACLSPHEATRTFQIQKTARKIVKYLRCHMRTPSLAELMRVCRANDNEGPQRVLAALVPEPGSGLEQIMNKVVAAAAMVHVSAISDIEPESTIIAYYCVFDGDNELHKVTCERQALVRQLCKQKLSIPAVDAGRVFVCVPVTARGFLSPVGAGARGFRVSTMASCKLLHVVAESGNGDEYDAEQRHNEILSEPLKFIDICQQALCLVFHFCGSYAAALRIREKKLHREQLSIVCWQGVLDTTAAKTFDEGFYKTYCKHMVGAKPQELVADAVPWIVDVGHQEGDATREELERLVNSSPIAASFISALDHLCQRRLPQTHHPVLLHGNDAYYLYFYNVDGREKYALSRVERPPPPPKDDATVLSNDNDGDYVAIEPPEDWQGDNLALYNLEEYGKIIENLQGKASSHGLAVLLERGKKEDPDSRPFQHKLFSDYIKKPLEHMVACIAVICEYQLVEAGTVHRALSIANETAAALTDIIFRFEDEDFLKQIQHGVAEQCHKVANAYGQLLESMSEHHRVDEDAVPAGKDSVRHLVKLAWVVRLGVAFRRSILQLVLFSPLEGPLRDLEKAQNTFKEWKATQEAKVHNDQWWKISVQNKTYINLALVIAADRKHLEVAAAEQNALSERTNDDAERKASDDATTHVWLPPESGMALTLNRQQFSPEARVDWWSRFAFWRRKQKVQDRIYWSIICYDDNALPRSRLPPRELSFGGAITIDDGIMDATEEFPRNGWHVNTIKYTAPT